MFFVHFLLVYFDGVGHLLWNLRQIAMLSWTNVLGLTNRSSLKFWGSFVIARCHRGYQKLESSLCFAVLHANKMSLLPFFFFDFQQLTA